MSSPNLSFKWQRGTWEGEGLGRRHRERFSEKLSHWAGSREASKAGMRSRHCFYVVVSLFVLLAVTSTAFPIPPSISSPHLQQAAHSPTAATRGTEEAGSTCLLQEDKVYERTVHRPHMGRGSHMRGTGVGHSKRGLAGSPAPEMPGQLASSQRGLRPPLSPSLVLPRMGKAGQGRPGVAQRLCYQGVSLRKGCDPLSSQEPLPGLGAGGSCGPWAGWRSGLSYAQTQAPALDLPVAGTQKGTQ